MLKTLQKSWLKDTIRGNQLQAIHSCTPDNYVGFSELKTNSESLQILQICQSHKSNSDFLWTRTKLTPHNIFTLSTITISWVDFSLISSQLLVHLLGKLWAKMGLPQTKLESEHSKLISLGFFQTLTSSSWAIQLAVVKNYKLPLNFTSKYCNIMFNENPLPYSH